jgi:membrane protease YdiL (CAAX protease family)
VTRWAAFVGLTGVVVTLLLILARLSQTVVSDRTAVSQGTSSRPFGDAQARDARTDPVIPRFDRPDSRSRPAGANNGPTAVDPHDFSTGALLANVVLTQGLFGALLAGGAVYFEVPLADLGIDATPLAAGGLGVAVGIGFGVTLWLGNEAAGRMAEVAGAGYDESLREMLAPDSLGGWVLLLGVVLPTIAFVEEFIFRAAAIGAVAAGFGISPWLPAVVSSLAFGIAHGAQGRVGVVVTGTLGFALAAGFVITESLLVVVVAHYLVNALELVVHEGLGVARGSEHV